MTQEEKTFSVRIFNKFCLFCSCLAACDLINFLTSMHGLNSEEKKQKRRKKISKINNS